MASKPRQSHSSDSTSPALISTPLTRATAAPAAGGVVRYLAGMSFTGEFPAWAAKANATATAGRKAMQLMTRFMGKSVASFGAGGGGRCWVLGAGCLVPGAECAERRSVPGTRHRAVTSTAMDYGLKGKVAM